MPRVVCCLLALLAACEVPLEPLPEDGSMGSANAGSPSPDPSYLEAIEEPTEGAAGSAISEEIPADAWAASQTHTAATRQAFDARYPLHGMAFHVLAHVRAAPRGDAPILGYMRRGARFRAARGPRGGGCKGRWYALSTAGYVCSGSGYLLADTPPEFEPVPGAPVLFDALPYPYAKTVRPNVFQFWREPTTAEATTVHEIAAKLDAEAALNSDEALDAAERTEQAVVETGEGQPTDQEETEADAQESPWPDYVRMRMEPGFYVSLDASGPAEAEFSRTVRGALIRTDALVPANPPQGIGVVLDEDSLPLGFAYLGQTKLFRRDAVDGSLRGVAYLPKFGARRLLDEVVLHDGKPHQATPDGLFISTHRLRIASRTHRPPLIPADARWLHISLENQTLVAYEGERAVFATLLSSGKEGHETPEGIFRIHAKHVSTTMDGLDGTDEAYSIEDVPWTMYFQGSYALHAAFWHRQFGNVRSHGCLNLAPADARWLFHWTTPSLPPGWHGVLESPDNPGTWVVIEQ